MPKRSRRGRGRGNKKLPVVTSGVNDVAMRSISLDSTEVDNIVVDQKIVNYAGFGLDSRERCGSEPKTSHLDLKTSHLDMTSLRSSQRCVGSTTSSGAPSDDAGSEHSVDTTDQCVDPADHEPVHTGFMQTGPRMYRAGSTVVKLDKCTDEEVLPEFRHDDICLSVECGDNKGLMYMSKLFLGSKGRCIEVDGEWYTPNEFQAVSGRESAKDWKRSIRHQGRSLKLLLSKNVLDVHPAACRCDSCRSLQQVSTVHSST